MARLEVFPVSSITDIQDVLKKSARWRSDPFDHIPLRNCSNHVIGLGCCAVVKQNPVHDPDYLAEYLAYYARGFEKTEKDCIRFHFFALPTISDNEEVLEYIDRAASSENSYLGFLTLRPIQTSPVGATFLRHSSVGHFILCKDEFPVHLAGKTLLISGTPFMQQDNAVGACAQASIWMALRTLRKRQGHSAFDPAQITTAATRFLVQGRTLPNRQGLNANQMVEAVRSAGYASHLHFFRSPSKQFLPRELEDARLWLYTYVESGIPVILGLFPNHLRDGHAVVLVGHGWSQNKNTSTLFPFKFSVSGNDFQIHHAVEWVTPFFIHNDNTGPYQEFPDVKAPGIEYSVDSTVFAIPLLPNDVFISGEEAEHIARELYADVVVEYLTISANLPETKVVFRSYLAERHEFREWICSSSVCPAIKNYYRQKILPRRVWITEINRCDDYGNLATKKDCRLGEIVLDPTGDAREGPFLAIHLNASWTLLAKKSGVLIDRDVDSGEITIQAIPNDFAYAALVR